MLMKKSERKIRHRLLRQSRILFAMTRAAEVRDTQFICEVLTGRWGQGKDSCKVATPSGDVRA
jgi:hypothetical protein